MKAAVLTKLNAPLEVVELELPELSFGQVLVKIHQSGICGAQLAEIRGEKGNAKFLPHLLGHEGGGQVIGVGDGVSRVKRGEKVVCHWRKAQGIQSDSPRYALNGWRRFLTGKSVGGGPVTTFQDWSVVSENRVTPVPPDTDPDLSALLGCGLSTALMTIEHEANLMMGERILIIGGGGLGLNLILAAKLRQASFIGVVETNEAKHWSCKQSGARMACASAEDFLDFKGSFDVVVDTSGSFSAVRDAFPLLASGGRFIMVGQPKPGASVEIPNARSLFDGEGKRIIATQGGGFRPDVDIPRYVAMHRAGLLRLDGLVTHRVTLDQINDGLELVRSGSAGRVMVMMQ